MSPNYSERLAVSAERLHSLDARLSSYAWGLAGTCSTLLKNIPLDRYRTGQSNVAAASCNMGVAVGFVTCGWRATSANSYQQTPNLPPTIQQVRLFFAENSPPTMQSLLWQTVVTASRQALFSRGWWRHDILVLLHPMSEQRPPTTVTTQKPRWIHAINGKLEKLCDIPVMGQFSRVRLEWTDLHTPWNRWLVVYTSPPYVTQDGPCFQRSILSWAECIEGSM